MDSRRSRIYVGHAEEARLRMAYQGLIASGVTDWLWDCLKCKGSCRMSPMLRRMLSGPAKPGWPCSIAKAIPTPGRARLPACIPASVRRILKRTCAAAERHGAGCNPEASNPSGTSRAFRDCRKAMAGLSRTLRRSRIGQMWLRASCSLSNRTGIGGLRVIRCREPFRPASGSAGSIIAV